MKPLFSLLCAVTIFLACGCRATQLQHDQDHMRQAILEMNTNQIMDNLIRAYKGLPILHMDYTRSTGTIRHTAGGSLLADQSVTTTGVVAVLTRSIRDVYGIGVDARHDNTLTVTAEPVLENNQVYLAYVSFLDIDPVTQTSEKLVESFEPPPPHAAHMIRECGGVFYWIPAQYKYAFLELSLTTTGARGRPLTVPTTFKVSVTDVRPFVDPDEDEIVPTLFTVTLSLSIPSDRGKMYATLDGIKETLPLSIVTAPGKPTNKFNVTSEKPIEKLNQLRGQTVEIELEKFRPPVPTTTNSLRDIRAELEQIRLEGI